ncbi:acyl carrier protein [Aquabacterium sp.]|uniref:acyl carrier protein n=1 Tax=Aquabacterium sp. TaxID=1872578 RepID=UPI0035C70B5A
MMDKATQTLQLVRQALTRYVDTPPADIGLASNLKELGVDSLTLAELLFELEDRLGTPIADATEVPQQVGDVVALILPYVAPRHLQQIA